MARFVTTVVIAAFLAGCAVPPRPQPPPLNHVAPLAGVPGKTDALWPDTTWWQRYHDDQLDALEARALAGAPTLGVARARFYQALRAIEVSKAEGGLDIAGNAQLQRERLSEDGLIPPKFLGFTWYSQGDLGLQFHYDFDFWGRHGAEVAAALDRARVAGAERDAAGAMITAAVADTYFAWQANQLRLATARELIGVQEHARAIAAARARQGVDSADVVLEADAQLAQAREQAADVAGAAAIQRAALAALLGISPAELPELKAQPLPQAPSALPVNAGLDLVARRADIAASRWRVEAALHEIDVARADFYPDLSLSALLGLQSIDLDKLFSAGSRVMSVGPALHLPIFENGRLHARFGASQSALQTAVADYNAAVVEAARDVAAQALTLQQVQARQHEHAAQLAAVESLRKSAQSREARGLSDARPALAAASELQRQRDAGIRLDAAALSAEIALTKALGGGYRPATTDSDHPDPVPGATSQ
jgi:multidrug efflux system outer membrane protein